MTKLAIDKGKEIRYVIFFNEDIKAPMPAPILCKVKLNSDLAIGKDCYAQVIPT